MKKPKIQAVAIGKKGKKIINLIKKQEKKHP